MVFGIIILFVGAFYLFNLWGKGVAGGGGISEVIPDTVKSGEPVTAKLELSVWGNGSQIKGRYTDVNFYYRKVGESNFKLLTSNPVPIIYTGDQQKFNGQYESYSFIIPPYPNGTTGEIEYYYDEKLDGQLNHTVGHKKIKIVSATSTHTSSNVNSTTITSSGDVKLTGIIQAINNQQPVDGNLTVEINNTWIVIGGGEMPTNNQGRTVNFDLNNVQANVGKKAEVFAKKSSYDQSLTILGDSKYYIKIIP